MKSKNKVNKKWDASKLQNNRKNKAIHLHNKEKASKIHKRKRIINTSIKESPHNNTENR